MGFSSLPTFNSPFGQGSVCFQERADALGLSKSQVSISGKNLHCKENVKCCYSPLSFFVCFTQTAAVMSLTQDPLATQQLLIPDSKSGQHCRGPYKKMLINSYLVPPVGISLTWPAFLTFWTPCATGSFHLL